MTEQVVAPGFEPVAAAFDALVAERGTDGLALCAYVGGRPVVDLWAGPGYGPHALQVLFSVTKGVTAVCAALLIDDGVLDPDAPVARYWPEFAQSGKDALTVAELLGHRAGLPVVEGSFTLEQWVDGTVADALASQAPLWPSGSAHGYHTLTYGVLADALVRRVAGCSVGELLARRIAGPLGLELWIGLPAEREAQVVPLIAWPPPEVPSDPASLGVRSTPDPLNLDADPTLLDGPGMRTIELAAVNGVGSARSLARLYAACVSEVDGIRLLRPDTVARVTAVESEGVDRVAEIETRFGVGFMLPNDAVPMAGPGSFGHDGMGGALAFAHPQLELSFGFVSDRMSSVGRADPATASLAETLVACLG